MEPLLPAACAAHRRRAAVFAIGAQRVGPFAEPGAAYRVPELRSHDVGVLRHAGAAVPHVAGAGVRPGPRNAGGGDLGRVADPGDRRRLAERPALRRAGSGHDHARGHVRGVRAAAARARDRVHRGAMPGGARRVRQLGERPARRIGRADPKPRRAEPGRSGAVPSNPQDLPDPSNLPDPQGPTPPGHGPSASAPAGAPSADGSPASFSAASFANLSPARQAMLRHPSSARLAAMSLQPAVGADQKAGGGGGPQTESRRRGPAFGPRPKAASAEDVSAPNARRWPTPSCCPDAKRRSCSSWPKATTRPTSKRSSTSPRERRKPTSATSTASWTSTPSKSSCAWWSPPKRRVTAHGAMPHSRTRRPPAPESHATPCRTTADADRSRPQVGGAGCARLSVKPPLTRTGVCRISGRAPSDRVPRRGRPARPAGRAGPRRRRFNERERVMDKTGPDPHGLGQNRPDSGPSRRDTRKGRAFPQAGGLRF